MFSLPSPSSALKVAHFRVPPTGMEPRTFWLPTSPAALPLSYRRLMEATKGHKTGLIWQTFWFVCLFLKVVACEKARASGEAARGRTPTPPPRRRASSRVPLARVHFTISPKWRAWSQANKVPSSVYPPTQTFLGLCHAFVGEDCMTNRKNVFEGGYLEQ